MIKRLLKSRKVMLAIIGIIQTILLNEVGIGPEIWAAIDGLLVALMGTIAWEDSAAKKAGLHPGFFTDAATAAAAKNKGG